MIRQSELKDFKELKSLAIDLQFLNLESKRMKMYEKLKYDVLRHPDNKRWYIKTYIYETQKIDKDLNTLRILLNKK